MTQYETKNGYIKQFQVALDQSGSERSCLKTYWDSQVQKLDQQIEGISQETFWQVLPNILGIDAKLMLLTESPHLKTFQMRRSYGLLKVTIEIFLKSCVDMI